LKTEVSLAVMNIARKSAQPVFAESGPEQQADARDEQATNENEFAQLVHGSRNKITLRSGFSSSLQCRLVTWKDAQLRPRMRVLPLRRQRKAT
jgi:hypothetical protein